jgi:hypothetical protein
MNMLRVWPLVVQFGVGALLCLAGIWAGFRGGYLNIRIPEDRRLVATLIVGYLLLLAFMSIFTFLSPHWANGGSL